MKKTKAPLNRTLTLTNEEQFEYKKLFTYLDHSVSVDEISNKTIHQDLFEVIKYLPDTFVDLLFLDPPYNLQKAFNGNKFGKLSIEDYSEYLDSFLGQLIRTLKQSASIYICGDYYSSTSIHMVSRKYFNVVNRITWQREKGRGAKSNWKNASEDIWFCTMSKDYKFYVDRVKEKRAVIAPYKVDGKPKDWEESEDGNFRLTHPSNIWTDLSVPYWSMPENTDHPTQKPEKLLAKIILASTDEGDIVLDPFLGSGTTSVVAKKLNRKYVGVEMDEMFCGFAEKRLSMADNDKKIQGYEGGVFWERNSLSLQKKSIEKPKQDIKLIMNQTALFD